MNFRQIENFMAQYPIYQYTLLDSSKIEFSDRVQSICQNECERYGASWSCPPAVGSLEECREICLQYPQVLLFSTIAFVKDYSDFQTTLESRREHEEITGQIENYIVEEGGCCYTLSSDSCGICETCTYPESSCRHPKLMHPCIESHGIVLVNTIEENKMDYFLGETMVLWFSLIFLDLNNPQ